MADFCKQCSERELGEDFGDMRGAVSDLQTRLGLYALVICEGCGPIQVNKEGECCSSDCGHHHHVEDRPGWSAKFPVDSKMKHVKTGGIYRVVVYSLQESDPNTVLFTYECLSTHLTWTRPVSELLDGRFVPHNS